MTENKKKVKAKLCFKCGFTTIKIGEGEIKHCDTCGNKLN